MPPPPPLLSRKRLLERSHRLGPVQQLRSPAFKRRQPVTPPIATRCRAAAPTRLPDGPGFWEGLKAKMRIAVATQAALYAEPTLG